MHYKALLLLLVAAVLALPFVPVTTGQPALLHAGEATPATDGFAKVGVAFVNQHCVKCHGPEKQRADLALHTFKDEASLLKDREKWEAAVRMVRAGEMPPSNQPRPPFKEIEAFARSVTTVFERADLVAKPDPGRVTIRRLNRAEYNNTIRDLVGVDFQPATDFPADDVGHGFDNIGDVLSLSPILMERYLAAAEAIVNRAIPSRKPDPPLRRVAAVFLRPREPRRQGERPPRSRDLYTMGDLTYAEHELLQDGTYILRVRARAQTKNDGPAQMAVFLNDKDVKTFDVRTRNGREYDEYRERLALKAGKIRIGAKLVSDFKDPGPDAYFRDRQGVSIQAIELEGPLDAWPDSYVRIMARDESRPKSEQARQILDRFASRAYRRPATPEEVTRLVKFVEEIEASGRSWDEGIRLALQAVLVSPKFLFRVELDDRPQTTDAHPISEYQLASRLSYFLWSSMPDEELFSLAAKGQLTPNLGSQIRRMLKDPKAEALIENFAVQWLTLRNLQTFAPDDRLFPRFDERLRADMLTETKLFFGHVMREDRNILELIDSDYTFLNDRLARHYGIPDIRGEEFREVKLPDGPRGGVLTQASILAVTSNPTRTSPVKRGKWVLEQILGEPPPPPPANVPELEEGSKAQLKGTLRQRMEQHRADPNCAVCHEKMDALGFAFENFDVVGAWRDKDGTFPINPAGTLPAGQTFNGPGELKKILCDKKELFARCLAEKMLTYSLGRGLEPYDRRSVEKIVQALAKDDYRFSTLVTAIVTSDPFRLRRGKGGAR